MDWRSSLLIGALGAVAALFWQWLRGRSGKGAAGAPPLYREVALSAVPDAPIPFGYKVSWLAVRATDPEAVAATVGVPDLEKANWRTGLEAAYEGAAFFSPPVDGWVLVVGFRLPDPGERRAAWERVVRPLASRFGSVGYFSTHRVVEYHAWAMLEGERILRAFAYLGERGEVLVNEGAATRAEIGLGFSFEGLPVGDVELEGPDEEWPRTPSEQDVLALAGAWSVSPLTLPDGAPSPSLGRVSRHWLAGISD